MPFSVMITITVLLALTNILSLGVFIFIIKKGQSSDINVDEDPKFKLAEANLKLLAQSEELEEQKFKMAEANVKLLEMKELIEEEKKKSDKLLLNILPVRVADDLKKNGRTEPENFSDVSVFFSDIVGFTSKSSELEPKILIEELNDIFTGFDNIIHENGCERIKTIGDAYLCVCGMPEKNDKHAENIVNSALQIISFLRERNRKSPIKWEVRIGIHSGNVVGGVVGVKKYIYDVFGDTINTASRMESYSEPMKINVSEKTWMLVKDKFNFIERDYLEVKGKGEIKMFFLDPENNF